MWGAWWLSQYLFSLQRRKILWNSISTVIHSGFYIVRKYTLRRSEYDLLVSAGWGIFENPTQIFAEAGVFFSANAHCSENTEAISYGGG